MSSKKTENGISLTLQIAITAILLALCIASQFFKTLSVYITGPVVNLCLIVAVMICGPVWGTALAIITPVTAFFIAASPVMQVVPAIIPLIMCGNIVLVITVWTLFKPAVKKSKQLITPASAVMALICSLAKGAFMGLTISLWLLPTFIPAESPLRGKMSVFQMTFSLTQFITALIGFVYFYIIWKPVSLSIGVGKKSGDPEEI